MQPEQGHSNSHLFTVRLWREHLGEQAWEVRCQVRHVASGETRHFRDWSQFTGYLVDKLNQVEGMPPQSQ